jgi:hypothetical protein
MARCAAAAAAANQRWAMVRNLFVFLNQVRRVVREGKQLLLS